MKLNSICLALFVAGGSVSFTCAQPASVSSASEYCITERGAHHRVWMKVSLHTNALGWVESQTNRYTELATGLLFLQDGQWVESREEIEVVAGGAVARFGQHKASFAANLATAGAIDLEMPDGQRLRSHVLGLSYFDASSGRSVVIAEVKDAVGELHSPNVLLYPSAFTDLKADVRYTYTRAGLEQDVILRERPPQPELYGLNPATTRLQVWTEFVEAPEPVRTTQGVRLKSGGELADDTLDWASVRIGQGRAFALGEETGGAETVVAKRWVTVEGRRCLVEEVALPEVRAALEVLPHADGAAVRPPTNGVRHAVSTQPLLPAAPVRRLARAGSETIQLAQARPAKPGLVLDYVVLNATENNCTFKGDETYLVSGPVNLTGTATFEGGAVVKYAKNAGAKLSLAAVTCQTGPYRPVVFTARDDNSVGQNISTGALSGYYANPALEFWNNPPATWSLTNFRVAYAEQAIKASSQAFALLLEHGQIVHCANGVRLPGQGDTTLRNVLFGEVQIALNDLAYANIIAQHVTLDGSGGALAHVNSVYLTVTLKLTNCVLANLNAFVVGGTATLDGAYNGFYQTPAPFGNPYWNPGLNQFVERGAGNYYLAESSAFRNVGTTALVPALLAALGQKTTARPDVRTAHFSSPETLSRNPSVLRDTSTGDLPDLGYHYEALDYVVNARTVSAPLTLSGGVVLGTYGAIYSYGLVLTSGGSFTSAGTPADLDWIVRYNTVQEQSVSSWSSSTAGASLKRDSSAATVNAVFTGWSLLAGVGEHFKDGAGGPTATVFSDCQFGGGKFTVYPGSTTLKNCLWERVHVSLRDNDGDPQWALYNNGFYGGTFAYRAMGDAPVLLAYDNLFDRTAIIEGLQSQPFTHDYNGYIAGYSRLLPTPSPENDVVLNNMVYATGSLGRWYHADAALADKGSRTVAQAGLLCSTTRTDHAPDEGTVDIGFHYTVPDCNCVPPGTKGFVVNLETTPEGYLRIKPTAQTTPLPFVNLANSGRGTVARIEVPNPWNPTMPASRVFGEYYTAPSGRGRNPSRTTVDRYGSTWVGNRGEGDTDGGSIAQLGVVVGGTRGIKSPENAPLGQYTFTPDANGQWIRPPTDGSVWYSTCPDRDGDGLIRTSAGLAANGSLDKVLPWSNAGGADTLGGVSTAIDEAIVRYVRVFPTAVRSIAVDRANHVWVGSSPHSSYDPPGNGFQEYIDGITGFPVTGRKLNIGSGGYGGLVDGYGTLWSAGYQVNGLLRFVPDDAQPPGTKGGIIPSTLNGYGTGIDPKTGDVWLGNYSNGTVWRFSEEGCHPVIAYGGLSTIRGIVIDGSGGVWIARSLGMEVYHIRTTGEPVGVVSVADKSGNYPYGLCIDSAGMIWAICYNGYAVRIDPALNPPSDPQHNPAIGVAVEAVPLGNGASPYNYSDMSGFVTLSTTRPSGFWDFIEDSAVNDMLWSRVVTATDVPAETEVQVEVRAANLITELPAWPFRTVPTDGTIPGGIKGRYLEVRTTLLRDFCVGEACPGPELRSLCVQAGSTGSALAITRHPQNQVVTPGAAATFEVVAPGATAFQWFRDGQAVGGNTSALTLAAAQYADVGRYTVRVADGSGAILDSAEARLHIKGNAPTPPTQPTMVPESPNLLDTVTLTASTSVTSAAIPPAVDAGYQLVSYQWRRGQTPIPGQTGTGLTATMTLTDVQCSDVGNYSVVFWNKYGQVSSPTRQLSLSTCPAVTIAATVDGVPASLPVTVQDENQTIILSAEYAFPRGCAQWYVTPFGGIMTKIPDATGDSYEIPKPIECDALGVYTVEVTEAWGDTQVGTASVAQATPSVTMQSVTLELNPSGGGTWAYTCEESTDGGVNYYPFGPQGQNWLVVATDANGDKNGYRYRIIAQQGGTTASVIGSVDSSVSFWTVFNVLEVQGGTTDVRFTAASPVGVGPWMYQWFKHNPNTGQYEPIPGAEDDSYKITAVDCPKQGVYRVRATDDCGGSATVDAYLLRQGCP